MEAMLLRMLFAASLGLILVLLLRKPMRRAFGAGPAFALWCLPVLMAAAPWVPVPIKTSPLQPMLDALPTQAFIPIQDTPYGTDVWLLALWLVGVTYGAGSLSWRYMRLSCACVQVPRDLRRRLQTSYSSIPLSRVWLHKAGPAVMWAPRTRLPLPADFFERHDAEAREMMLRHECTHLCRGDAWWSLMSECMLVLLWFHPLAWFALPRFQLDQEITCDESVLRQTPQDEVTYARALMRSSGVDAQPAMIPWLAEPQLKERLTMISRHSRHAWRRRLGYGALVALLAGSTAFAQTTIAHRSTQMPLRTSRKMLL